MNHAQCLVKKNSGLAKKKEKKRRAAFYLFIFFDVLSCVEISDRPFRNWWLWAGGLCRCHQDSSDSYWRRSECLRLVGSYYRRAQEGGSSAEDWLHVYVLLLIFKVDQSFLFFLIWLSRHSNKYIPPSSVIQSWSDPGLASIPSSFSPVSCGCLESVYGAIQEIKSHEAETTNNLLDVFTFLR